MQFHKVAYRLCLLFAVPIRYAQGAPLEAIREGLGTIAPIKGEWDINVDRVTKGMVRDLRLCYMLHIGLAHLVL